jgi:hypothetical protein
MDVGAVVWSPEEVSDATSSHGAHLPHAPRDVGSYPARPSATKKTKKTNQTKKRSSTLACPRRELSVRQTDYALVPTRSTSGSEPVVHASDGLEARDES